MDKCTKTTSFLIFVLFLHLNEVMVTSSKHHQGCMNVTYEWVDCSNMSLAYISAQEFTTTLNVSHNYVGEGALDVRLLAQWKSLQSLDLSYNGITIFIGRGAPLNELQYLNLSRNTLFDLKPRIFTNMNSLKFLNLAFNRITLISPSAIILPNLVWLDLRFNRLTTLRMHYFQRIPSLKEIILSHNLISSIPGGTFFNCKALQNIDVSFNRISRVSKDAFRNDTSLSILDLSFNSLDRSISVCFQTKILIGRLVFNGNRFGNFHADYVTNIKVRTLEICKIATLFYISDKSFHSLSTLEVLRLEDNSGLRYISSESFYQMPNLKLLSIIKNNLFTLDSQIALRLPNLSHLDISENNFHCDCSLKWLQEAVLNASSPFHGLNVSDVTCDQENLNTTTGGNLNTTYITQLSALPSFCEPYMEVLANDVISVDLSTNVSVKCVSSGYQSPELQWFSDRNSSAPVDKCPGRICQSKGHLWVHSVREQDAGAYRCVVQNDLGECSRSIRIVVVRPNVTLIVTQVSSNFVILHWVIHKDTPRVNTCVFLYKNTVAEKVHRAVLHGCHHRRFYTLINLDSDIGYNISMYKQHRRHLFKMASLVVRTKSESIMQMLTTHYKFWVLCSVVIVLVSSPVIISCIVQSSRYVYKMRRKQHSEMTMFMESDSGTCFVLDTDDTSLSYLSNSDDSQLLA